MHVSAGVRTSRRRMRGTSVEEVIQGKHNADDHDAVDGELEPELFRFILVRRHTQIGILVVPVPPEIRPQQYADDEFD